jgi:hypothetical protein
MSIAKELFKDVIGMHMPAALYLDYGKGSSKENGAVVLYLFDHSLPPAPSPPECHRHGKEKGHSRRARSSRRSERLLDGGGTGKKAAVGTVVSTRTRPRKIKMQRWATM